MADENRRQMLVLLKGGEKTPSELAENFEFTLPAVSTHLRVLRDAGLVTERKSGKNRFYSVNKDALTDMINFLDDFWEDALGRLKGHVERDQRRRRLERQ